MKVPLKKVTIVAERLLRELLVELLNDEGSTGHTMMAVEGKGSRGVHASDWEGRNIQLETIVSHSAADRILDRIAAEYLENYAVIAYVCDVDVLRGKKFTNETGAGPDL
ncbi:MAG: nitrogen regulatory protein P-II 2 [Verrucomicrobiales bacterium]|jgi:nitrogen regulatory protein P-II 2